MELSLKDALQWLANAGTMWLLLRLELKHHRWHIARHRKEIDDLNREVKLIRRSI